MADTYERFVQEIHESLNFWATWSPAERVRLGDCGPIRDWDFDVERNVEDFGIEFEVARGTATMPMSHTSDQAMKIVIQSKLDAQKIPEIPAGTAGIKVGFERKDAIVFALVGGRIDRIKDVFELKRQVIAKAQSNEFPEDFIVVTSVVAAKSASVLISEDDNSSFVVSADADFKAGIVDIANASLGVRMTASEKVRTELMAAGNVTPLFTGFKLKANVWRDFDADVLADNSLTEDDMPFVDISPDVFSRGQ